MGWPLHRWISYLLAGVFTRDCSASFQALTLLMQLVLFWQKACCKLCFKRTQILPYRLKYLANSSMDIAFPPKEMVKVLHQEIKALPTGGAVIKSSFDRCLNQEPQQRTRTRCSHTVGSRTTGTAGTKAAAYAGWGWFVLNGWSIVAGLLGCCHERQVFEMSPYSAETPFSGGRIKLTLIFGGNFLFQLPCLLSPLQKLFDKTCDFLLCVLTK